jgi:hypothetical protein
MNAPMHVLDNIYDNHRLLNDYKAHKHNMKEILAKPTDFFI